MFDKAFDVLRDAVVLDDGMEYDEPWGIMIPVRHALGGLLWEFGGEIEKKEWVAEKNIVNGEEIARKVFLEVSERTKRSTGVATSKTNIILNSFDSLGAG